MKHIRSKQDLKQGIHYPAGIADGCNEATKEGRS